MSKLEKADKTGKTLEAWWSLLFTEGSLGRTALGFGAMLVGGSFGAWVASVTSWISSYGVAGWAFCICAFALMAIWAAAGLEHIRHRRLIRSSLLDASYAPELDYQPDTLDRDSFISREDITETIETKLNEFLATTLRAEFATHAHMHARDERIAEIANESRTAKGSARLAFDHAQNKAAEANARLDEIAKGCSDLELRMNDWTRAHTDNNENQFRNVDGGFRAIRHREILQRIADTIGEKADYLLRSSRGEKVENWGVWNNEHFQWQKSILEYGNIAAQYLVDVPGLIIDVPSHRLQGEWPEDRHLFPSDDAMIAHRTTAVTMQNFRKQHERVMQCVTSFAFESPSMKGISNR